MKGSAGIESHPVGGISLETDGGDLVVKFEYDGKWYEGFREVNDGPISHTLHANGIKSIIDEG
jgi:hypothetical protein